MTDAAAALGRRCLRHWDAALLFLVVAALIAIHDVAANAFLDAPTLAGWLLTGAMIVLTLNRWRDRLMAAMHFSRRACIRFHVGLGAVAALLLVLHADLRWPDGPLEAILAILFYATCVSGVVGYAIALYVPARLAVCDHIIRPERFQQRRNFLRKAVEDLVVHAAEATGSDALRSLYADRLRDHLDEPRDHWGHLVHTDRVRYRHAETVRLAARSLSDEERRIAGEINGLVQQKCDLDFQEALQRVQTGWLLVHLPLAVAAAVLTVAHILVALVFAGGTL